MTKDYSSLYKGGEAEITEKKSRFIATTMPASTIEEAAAFIEQMRKKYWDARHNCYAYVIGNNNEFQKCSDDGEPSKTAGWPMLDVLLGEGIHNAVVVVTRYFGGTLLGTGGLIRAYQKAAKEGLANSTVITKKNGIQLEIYTDYNSIGKIQYILGSKDIIPVDIIYTDTVTIKLAVPKSETENLKKEIVEALNGKVEFSEGKEIYFSIIEGDIVIDVCGEID